MSETCVPGVLPVPIDELEAYLRRQRTPEIAALGFPDAFVLPCYSLSIANVPGTIAGILRRRLRGVEPALPAALWHDLAQGVRRVVWIILDAVGWQPFAQLAAEEEQIRSAWLGEAGRLFPITSVVPTTTTSALITLWTGAAPAQHGLVGHTMLLREFGLVADMLKLGPIGAVPRDQLLARGLDLQEFLPVPGLAAALAREGIHTRSLINVDLAQTGFSRLSFRGVEEVIRFVTAPDMWVRIRETLSACGEEPLLVVGYLSEFDGIGHVLGPGSDAWRAVMRALAYSLQSEFRRGLAARERAGTLLIMTADHGQLLQPATPVRLADYPGLSEDLLLPPTGSPRGAYFYAGQGRREFMRHYVEHRLAEQFAVVDAQAALAAGLFGQGEHYGEVRYRIGDLLLFAQAHYALEVGKNSVALPGLHAGLSGEEMLVPLLLTRLD